MSTRPNQPSGRRRETTRPMDAPQVLVGRTLEGRYRLDEVLNTGGMGIIFSATQLSIGRRVAVKILRPSLTKNPSLVERFQLEVETVAQIAHPNVVKLIDTGRDSTGLTYLVMEFVEGKTLRQALRHRELRLSDILRVFAQVCDALIETHGQQIIHRDLKFDNIMIQRMRDGTIHVKLLDFGVAKLLSQDHNLTEGGQVAGTPAIVAPELVDGAEPTARSDLYSLGVLLFASFAGRLPFTADNDLELMRAHKTEPLPNLRKIVGDQVPEEVVDLTYELLAKDPSHRPRSAHATARRLRRMADRFDEQFPDATAYVPPESVALEQTPEKIEKISGIKPIDTDDGNGNRNGGGLFGRLFSRRVVAPMSVVAGLFSILMILVIALIYFLYQELM